MTAMMVTHDQNSALIVQDVNPVDGWIAAWLDAKIGHSGSKKTEVTYRGCITDFRAVLRQVGLDLNGDPGYIALAAQGWAGKRKADADDRAVSPYTYNQRLAVLGSFYAYCIKNEFLEKNPIARVERRKVQAYATARALDAEDMARNLAGIDRSTLAGQRDYALLCMALVAGRRLSELAALRWCDLVVSDGKTTQVTLNWPHMKGGKVGADKLSCKR